VLTPRVAADMQELTGNLVVLARGKFIAIYSRASPRSSPPLALPQAS